MVAGWTESAPAPGPALATVQVRWAMHRVTPAGDVVAGNRAPAYGVLLVVRAHVDVCQGDQRWRVPAGCAFLRQPSLPYDYHFAPGGEFLSVGLYATLFGAVDLLRGLGAPRVWQPNPADAALLATCLGELAKTTGQHQPAARLITCGLAQTVVGVVCRALTPPQAAARLLNTPPWLTAVLQAAQDDPGVTVAELAQVAAYSEGQLRRLFHSHLGLSPHAFLQSRRLEAARHLLETTDLPVGSIAARLGFGSAPHFTRLYKQAFGLAPRDYRRHLDSSPV